VGLGGAVVRWGERTSSRAAWALLAAGTVILAVVAAPRSAVLLVWVVAGFVAARVYAARSASPDALFHALLVAVAVDLVAMVVAAS